MGNSNSQRDKTGYESYHDRDMQKSKQLNQNSSTTNTRTKTIASQMKIKRKRGMKVQMKDGKDDSLQQSDTPKRVQVHLDQVTLKEESQQPTTPLSQNTQKTFPDSVGRLSIDLRSEGGISPKICMVNTDLFGDERHNSLLIRSSCDEERAVSAASSDQAAEADADKCGPDRIRVEHSEFQSGEFCEPDQRRMGVDELQIQSMDKIENDMELSFSALEQQWQSSSTMNSSQSGIEFANTTNPVDRQLFIDEEDDHNSEAKVSQGSDMASLQHVISEDEEIKEGEDGNMVSLLLSDDIISLGGKSGQDSDEASLLASEDDNISLGDLKKPDRREELDELDQIIDGNDNDIVDEFEELMNEIEHDELTEDDENDEHDGNDDQSLNSMFSQSDCSDYESLGPTSVSDRSYGHQSIGDLSFAPVTTEIIRQRARRLSLGPDNGSMSTSFKRRRPAKPTATNAFETLPRHLIKNSLIRQAASTLRDERFLTRRITKLGAVYAAKVHVSDFICMEAKISKDAEKNEEKRMSLEATMPSAAAFTDGDNVDSITIDSFELFEKCILELCGIIQMVSSFDEEDEEDDDANNGGDTQDKTLPNITDDTVGTKLEAKISLSDGGRALYSLGKYCQKVNWNDDAMHFYKHALYLYFLDVGVEESRLLDNSDDCDGFFYVQAARSCVHDSSHTHQYLANIFTKMGDIHGRCSEKNDALRAYRASEVFWRKHIADLQSEDADNDDEIFAAVEALALSFNRVGGVYTAKGELDAALFVLHEGLEMQMETLGEDHVEVAKTLHNIGVCHRHNDDWESALEFYVQAHDIFEARLGREHLDTVRTLHNIGSIHRRRKEYAKAMDCFKKVLLVRRRALGDDHPSVSITLVSMAAVLRRCGKKEEANKFYAAAVH